MKRRSLRRAPVRQGAPDIARLRRELEELSRNLWWSWNGEATSLWQRVAAELPETRRDAFERNPVAMVRALRKRHLRALAADPGYMAFHGYVLDLLREYLADGTAVSGFSARRPVAYFSMEFGLHESMPVYAGGLGILAGDHLKSASDERLPLVGVGLFYHEGYFRQELDGRGRQKVVYPRASVADLPMEAVRTAAGRELRVPVELPDGTVKLRVWRVRVGRVSLYLLDSDVPENRPSHRRICRRLYGGTREDRIRQEVVAGIGGVRALRALGIQPGVWHLNEGHVAFITIERMREIRKSLRLTPAEAIEVVAANTVFTTHTPVPEGNEEFDPDLAARYLAPHARAAGIRVQDYIALGRHQRADGRIVLSMTVLALRLSRFRNGVSRLHGEVSRRMWSHLWPGFPAEETPITSVTNGVHTQSWVAPEFDDILSRHAGPDWFRHLDDPPFWNRLLRAPEEEIWSAKQKLKDDMIRFVRAREDARLERLGVSAARRRARVESLLDPGILTIGFARRFALYKRAALLFRDIRRAQRLLGSRKLPLQIIFAGKPHPEDPAGKLLFEQIAAISERKEFKGRVVLIENYDIQVCRNLVRGVDIWLNNPRRPQEASGTSGQKVPVNGGINVSVLDGWWCEGHGPNAGWAFGRPVAYADPARQDAEDSEALYRVLEREVVPLYYRRDSRGIPVWWFRKVKSSMAALVPRFSTSHMVLEYARQLYLPALWNGEAITASRAHAARVLAAWSAHVLRHWPRASIRTASVAPPARGKAAARRSGARRSGSITLEMHLPGIDPRRLVCRDPTGVDVPVRVVRRLAGDLYRLEVSGLPSLGLARGRLRVRIFPAHPFLAHPHELGIALETVL